VNIVQNYILFRPISHSVQSDGQADGHD